ncbi:MAG: terminase TerL endonuclease subunit, partial [Sciscionella sp.]
YELYEEEQIFVREALTVGPDGRLPYSELIYSAPKKSGKTALGAMILLYVTLILGGPFAEGYVFANDLEQSVGRVFQQVARLLDPKREKKQQAKITERSIVFSNGSVINAMACDYAGAAGANPTISCFDELWAFTSERSRRLWDEMVPVPTRKISIRLTTTYSGFSGESALLEELHKRGLQGVQIAPDLYRQPGMLMFWTNRLCAPWQSEAWREQMRGQLRPNAYLRLIENRWVTSESSFIPIEWFDACVEPELRPELTDPHLPVFIGVDASVKRDSTAIVACAFDHQARKVRLIWHRVFQPSPDDPLDFEATVERTLLELKRRFYVREIRFDPWQMMSVAQRLRAAGLPMVEFPQSVPNLTEASTNLFELLKGRNLRVYEDDDLRLAVSRAVALETSRGWRISKEKASHKIDVVVALAQAALGAVQQGQVSTAVDLHFQARAVQTFAAQTRQRERGTFDSAQPDRLYANGPALAAREDAQVVRLKQRFGRWRSF